MQSVETQLKAIANLIDILIRTDPGQYEKTGSIIAELDKRRDEVIETLNRIWSCFGFNTLPIPTQIRDSTDVWEHFS